MPKFYELTHSLLEIADDGIKNDSNAEIVLARKYKLNKVEKSILKSSGGERLFLNKIRWAKTHLVYAKLLKKTSRGRFAITTRGREVLEIRPESISEKFLSRFDEYKKKRGIGIKWNRVFAMPNRWTFEIQPIAELLDEELEGFIVDPFSGQTSPADIKNDLNPNTDAHFHMEAEDFLQTLGDESVDTMIDDPPYTPTQVTRCYDGIGLKASKLDTSSNFYARYRKDMQRVVTLGGKIIKFGYNTCGYDGFTLERELQICHGGAHNDTLCTVWRKVER